MRPAGLVTQVSIPLNAQAAYEQVARTPADVPLVCAAPAPMEERTHPPGARRLREKPLLAMDDSWKPRPEAAARNAFHGKPPTQWLLPNTAGMWPPPGPGAARSRRSADFPAGCGGNGLAFLPLAPC